MSKRFDASYSQICGYIPKDLARRFKVACAERELNQSEAMEEMITAWVQEPVKKASFNSLAELVAHWWEELSTTRITSSRLEAILNGAKPTPIEQVYLGSVCGDIDLVIDLVEKIPAQKGKAVSTKAES